MTLSARVHSENADIAFDVDGSGPWLLLIAGAGGDSHRYAAIAQRLAEHYRVIRYDRRCNSRSTGDSSRPLDMPQQARDAAAVIDAAGAGKALVFGNSGGANIALKLAEDFPHKVAGLVIHEPPALPLLADAAHWLAFSDEVEAAFHEGGVKPAMIKFLGGMQGLTAAAQGPGGGVGSPASEVNLAFFLRHELHAICRFNPALDRLRNSAIPIIATAGRASGNAYYARTAAILAHKTGAQHRTISGHHIAFVTDPDLFACELGELLHALHPPGSTTEPARTAPGL